MTREKSTLNRRRFLKRSVAGLAGAAILPALNKEAGGAIDTPEKQLAKKPVYRALGKTGLKLPVISLGSKQDLALYDVILDTGPTLIFTAQFYQNGNHEKNLGEALKNRKRDSYLIATAIGLGSNKDGFILEKDASQLTKLFEKSLPRLKTDHVDIFFLSFAKSRDSVLNDDLLSAAVKLKKEGKTRLVGIATHENEAESIRAAADSKVHDVALSTYNFKHPQRGEIKKAFAYAATAGLGTLAMKTHAGRFWDKDNEFPINTKAALKWAVGDGTVDSALYRIDALGEINDYVAIMGDLELTPQELKDLKLGEEHGFNGLYCPQCGKCRTSCPHGLDIPTLMRGYMYAYGYRQPLFAKEAIASVDLSRAACRNCIDCSVDCQMGFDVKEKVLDIARLRDVPDEFLAG